MIPAEKLSAPDWLEVVRGSFFHRVEIERKCLQGDDDTCGKNSDGRYLMKLAQEVEELAGNAESIRDLTLKTQTACQKELSCLPRPVDLCSPTAPRNASDHKTIEEQAGAAVSATLDRLGLVVPWRVPGTCQRVGSAASIQESKGPLECRRNSPSTSSTSKSSANHATRLQAQISKPFVLNPSKFVILHAQEPTNAHASSDIVCGRVSQLGSRRVESMRATSTPTSAPDSSIADLLLSLRQRMAARIQRAWRCWRARRGLCCKKACMALLSIYEHFHRKHLIEALLTMQKLAEAVANQAARSIGRQVRGWLARRQLARIRWQAKIIHHRCHCVALRGIASSFHIWVTHARAGVRRSCLIRDALRRPPPKDVFWRLFPLEGKSAVATAQHDWKLQTRVILGWLQFWQGE